MAWYVNTNIAAINAQRNLSNTLTAQSKTLQRLSSGLRINSAADDAAGLALSTGLKAQINGLNQAMRNANDGNSLLGTAESAISEQTNIVQRLRELAVQAASDTNSVDNRVALNNEAVQLTQELDRIAQTTQFNGVNLLDGSYASKDLQVGANATANDRISLTVDSTRSNVIGSAYTQTGTAVTAANLASGDVTFTLSSGSVVTVGASATDSAKDKAAAINTVQGTSGVTATATTSATAGAAQTAGTLASGDLTINAVNIGAVTTSGTNTMELVNAINAKQSQTGVTATMDSVSSKITLAAADGRNIVVGGAAGNQAATEAVTGITFGTSRGTIGLRSNSVFTVGGTTVAKAGLTAGAATLGGSLQAVDITTKAGAQAAILTADTAISSLNSVRSKIGALSNRLSSTINNLSSAVENASSANSRIQDADFAAETAAFTRSQILAQAGTAILSQANAAPQGVLALLK